jgi:hypothetical protein
VNTVSPPDLQPTLVGETILIRPIRVEDWPEMFRAASDPLIWEVHPARERYRELVFREYFDGAMASKSTFAFVDRGKYSGVKCIPKPFVAWAVQSGIGMAAFRVVGKLMPTIALWNRDKNYQDVVYLL